MKPLKPLKPKKVEFRRSRSNQMIGGVCAGIARHLGLDPSLVRFVTALLGFFSGAWVIMVYAGIWVLVPEADADADEPALDVDWQADGLRLEWQGAIAGYSVPWSRWMGIIALLAATACITGALAMVGIHLQSGTPVADLVSMYIGIATACSPLALIAIVAGWTQRPYAATITHDALWVERPLRGVERIDPSDIETVVRGGSGLRIHLRSGEQHCLPAPPPGDAVDQFMEEVRRARARVLDYREDLEGSADERARLKQLVGRESEG